MAAARVGRPARPARLRVRDPRRQDRRDRALRDRGGGLRDARPARTSSRSCARGAASSRRPPPGSSRGWSRSRTCAATCTRTPSPPTARRTSEEMVEGARKRGYEYLAITDHSASHGFGNDVARTSSRSRSSACAALNAAFGDGFELLIGTETNILPDGSLDYPDELLAQLDWVVASVHTVVPDERRRHDRADGRRGRAPARRRDRAPDRAQDRVAPAVRGRHGEASSRPPPRRARCSRSTPRRTGATSTSSHARAAGGGRRADRDRLRRALRRATWS